jgi:hypothetical protein
VHVTTTAENDVVAELARKSIADTAPQELPLFRLVSQAYFEDPEQVLDPPKRKDDLLGFGPAGLVLLVTPAALEAAKSIVGYLLSQLKGSLEHETSEAIAARVHRLFHRDANDDDAPRLTREQLARVRELALEKAHQLNLPEAQADLLADSMVGSLALG